MELNLKKPIVFFDIESTGTNVAADRICEICFLKISPDGKQEIKTRRINPTIPIPAEVSLIHGIYDEDVKDEPTFKYLCLFRSVLIVSIPILKLLFIASISALNLTVSLRRPSNFIM